MLEASNCEYEVTSEGRISQSAISETTHFSFFHLLLIIAGVLAISAAVTLIIVFYCRRNVKKKDNEENEEKEEEYDQKEDYIEKESPGLVFPLPIKDMDMNDLQYSWMDNPDTPDIIEEERRSESESDYDLGLNDKSESE